MTRIYKLIAIIIVLSPLGFLLPAYDKLNDAIQDQDVDRVRLALFNDASAINEMYLDLTPLGRAIGRQQDVRIVELLIEHGADVNTLSSSLFCFTPLHVAAMYHRKEIVQLLLQNGALINARDASDCTPLHIAVDYANENQDIISLLIESGANIHAKDNRGRSPFEHLSIEYMNNIGPIFITAGIDASRIYGKGQSNATMLSKASILTQVNCYGMWYPCDFPPDDIFKIDNQLQELEAMVEQESPEYKTLYNNVVAGDVTQAEKMLTEENSLYKQYINQQDAWGATLLMYAAARGHYKMVKLLLKHGAIIIDMYNGWNIFQLLDYIVSRPVGTDIPILSSAKREIYVDILLVCMQPVSKALLLLNKRKTDCFLNRLPKDTTLDLVNAITCGTFYKYVRFKSNKLHIVTPIVIPQMQYSKKIPSPLLVLINILPKQTDPSQKNNDLLIQPDSTTVSIPMQENPVLPIEIKPAVLAPQIMTMEMLSASKDASPVLNTKILAPQPTITPVGVPVQREAPAQLIEAPMVASWLNRWKWPMVGVAAAGLAVYHLYQQFTQEALLDDNIPTGLSASQLWKGITLLVEQGRRDIARELIAANRLAFQLLSEQQQKYCLQSLIIREDTVA